MLEDLLNLTSQYGIVVVLAAGIGAVIFFWGKNRFIPSIKDIEQSTLPTGLPQAVEQLNNDADLDYHIIFATLTHRLNNEIPTLDLLPSKPVKQQMFRDILSIYIRSIIKTCREIAEMDMDDWSPEKWCDEIIRKLNSGNMEFADECKTFGIPEIVLTKFGRWHLPVQDIMFDGIMSLGSSNIFTSNISRTNTLFFMLNLLSVTTIGNAEKTLKELNGDVHGKIYNGKVIEE